MELFWKTAGGLLIAAVLTLSLGNQKDLAQVLTALACTMGTMVALSFLEPVLDFLWALQRQGEISGESLSVLLKIAGIGLVAELGSALCSDTGNASLGHSMQLVASMVILQLSIPLFRGLLELLEDILGAV